MPLPLPLAAVIVIQSLLLLALQAHPVGAVTVIVPLPPDAGEISRVGEIQYVHEVDGLAIRLTLPLRSTT